LRLPLRRDSFDKHEESLTFLNLAEPPGKRMSPMPRVTHELFLSDPEVLADAPRVRMKKDRFAVVQEKTAPRMA
jgi:hypothetical protein